MPHTHDVLVLGRGIAGAVLTETLLRRGLRVHVFDHKRAGNASMVAAGVVNPIVLKRVVPSWRAHELLPFAEAFYTAWERRLHARFQHPIELVRLFPGAAERLRWEQAMEARGAAPFIDRRPQPTLDTAPVHIAHGHGTVHRAAWVDVPGMLEAQRLHLLGRDALTEADIAPEAIVPEANGVRIGERTAPLLVRCEGPFAHMRGLVPVKGEGITVRLPELRVDRMCHRGVFLLPQGEDTYRVGATFAWDAVWEGPTAEARDHLLAKLGEITPARAWVSEQWTGVRPTTRDRRPIMGRTLAHEAVFNGLGSRGVLLAPWCADHLVRHLFDGAPLDPEVDQGRWLGH